MNAPSQHSATDTLMGLEKIAKRVGTQRLAPAPAGELERGHAESTPNGTPCVGCADLETQVTSLMNRQSRLEAAMRQIFRVYGIPTTVLDE